MEILDHLTWMDALTLSAALAGIGGLAGFLAGLMGVGGGFVLVPCLLFVFSSLGFEGESLMHVCVGTSLAVVMVNGISSVRAHHKRDSVSFKLVGRIAPGIVLGVVMGTVISNLLSGEALKQFFVIALFILSAVMLSNPARFTLLSKEPGQPWSALVGSVIGSISTLVGIGGSTMSVPYMSLCQVPMQRAVGTASALGIIISVPAMLGYILIGLGEVARPPFSLGYVNILAWLIIVPFSFFAAPFGAKAAHALPKETLRKIFATFMIVIALKMAHAVYL